MHAHRKCKIDKNEKNQYNAPGEPSKWEEGFILVFVCSQGNWKEGGECKIGMEREKVESKVAQIQQCGAKSGG